MKIKFLFFILCSIVLSSCNLVTQEVTNWMEMDERMDMPTTLHLLEEDDIKITLPKEFERYSLYDYQQMLDSIYTKDQYKTEVARIERLMDIDGNLYMYFDPINGASYTINTMKYYPFNRDEAKMLLGMMSDGMEKNTRFTDLTYEKITGKYYQAAGRRNFKAIYRLENKKVDVAWFSTVYFIAENDKMVYVQLNTPFMFNFDPLVAKMIF